MRTLGLLLAAATTSLIAGCSGKTDNGSTPTSVGQVRATLRRAASCDDLQSSLKADALAKMNKNIDSQIKAIQNWGTPGYYGYGIAAPETANAGTAKGTATDSSSPAPGSSDSSSATAHSDTNTQVAGVDEADIVKTDGKYIYLLHGQTLDVLNAWPAASLAQTSSLTIEGDPSEMFQWENKIVVYSQVDGTSIYSAAGVTPRDNFQDYPYAYGGVATDVGVATPMGPGGMWMNHPLTKITVVDLGQNGAPAVSREVYFEGGYLSSRRIDNQVRTILQGAAPGPQLKLYPDTPAVAQNVTSQPTPGSAQDAQLKQAWIDALEALRAANTATINASSVTDWIPYSFSKSGSGISATTLACESFYLPTPGSTQYGLTHIEGFDASSASSTIKSVAIVGQADTVYSNQNTMVLAAHAWIDREIYQEAYASSVSGSSASSGTGSSGGGTASSGGTVVSTPPSAGSAPASPPSPSPTPNGVGIQSVHIQNAPTAALAGVETLVMNSTHLHEFDIATDPSDALYVASGTVPGSVGDQFAIDERNGIVRVSTSEQRSYFVSAASAAASSAPDVSSLPRSANHVFALANQAGKLETIGSVGDLAPGESIMSTRFVGDVGYVVTYLQKDPLFVIDLKIPSSPIIAGQITIPGFSSYMHPIDDTHLLTIGQDGGLALQIFDVTNPAAPLQTSKFVYTNGYGYSEAQSNHKAFTYFADRQLLAFPYTAYGSSSMKSTLELFKIDVTNGIQRLGAVDHTAFFGGDTTVNRGYCGGYFDPSVRRGVFLDNVVYSISYGGVLANDATTLAPLASLALPQPTLTGDPACGTAPTPIGD